MLGEEKEKIDVLVLVCGFEDHDLSSNSGSFSGENIHIKSHALFQVDTMTARPACPLRRNNTQTGESTPQVTRVTNANHSASVGTVETVVRCCVTPLTLCKTVLTSLFLTSTIFFSGSFICLTLNMQTQIIVRIFAARAGVVSSSDEMQRV